MKLRFVNLFPLTENDQIAFLSRIVTGIQDGWHDWVEPDPEDPRLDDYYAQNPTHRELLTKSYTYENAYESRGVRTVVIAAHCEESLTGSAWSLEEASLYLAQALEIVVENSRNDGKFFKACWRALEQPVFKQLTSRQPGVRFSQGGGKAEVLKVIEDRTQDALDRRAVPPRMFILLDSDAKYPGHRTPESNALLNKCLELGFPIALLDKRSIENYVGDDALDDLASAYPEVRPSVDFLKHLQPNQRDHYPIKSGIETRLGNLHGATDGEKALYANVTWPPGFKPKLERLMHHILREDDLLTETDLAKRGAKQELIRIGSQIEREI